MKVYILTTGSYSDYKIEGVFSSIETLEAGKEKIKDSDVNDPEEYEVDEILTMKYGPTWFCKIYIKTGEINVSGEKSKSFRNPESCTISETVAGFHDPQIFVTSPISQEHAIKVAIEKRQERLRTLEN